MITEDHQRSPNFAEYPQILPKMAKDWVNPSKRGEMDGVFRGRVGMLQNIF